MPIETTSVSNFIDARQSSGKSPFEVNTSNGTLSVSYANSIRMLETMVEFKELKMMYACAVKEVQTKFDVLNTEFSIRHRRNPISSVSSRLKSSASIIGKLERYGLSFSIENIANNIFDFAGVRVVCSYTDDIYLLASALTGQDDVSVIRRKDYIKTPKENGYRSLHLVIGIPVFFADRKRIMPVEVQFRTIAMDYWASLEHQLKYKKEIPDEEEITDHLKKCATMLAETDEQMLRIRHRIEECEDRDDEMELLIQKIARLDLPL